MNIDQLAGMTESDLQARATAHLADLDLETESEQTREHHVTQATFYLTEIDRRENARIANRDHKLELWVIGLIGAELVLAVVGIVFGWIEGDKQARVLDQLNQSSAATAATLTALRQAQETSLATQKTTLDNISAMNDAIRDELDLNFTDVIQYSGGMSGGGQERMDFANNGRTALFVWGIALGNQSAKMRETPTTLTPGSSVSVDVSQLVEKMKGMRHGLIEATMPITFHLKRENGTKYVASGVLKYGNGNFLFVDGKITTKRKQW